MSTTLELLVLKLLPASLRPFAKSVFPALFTIVAVGVQYASTGAFDKPELATAITGLSAALVTFLTTNHTQRTDEPVDLPSADRLLAFAGAIDPPPTDEPADEADVDTGDLVLTNGPRSLS
jgi:hypothetical protein